MRRTEKNGKIWWKIFPRKNLKRRRFWPGNWPTHRSRFTAKIFRKSFRRTNTGDSQKKIIQISTGRESKKKTFSLANRFRTDKYLWNKSTVNAFWVRKFAAVYDLLGDVASCRDLLTIFYVRKTLAHQSKIAQSKVLLETFYFFFSFQKFLPLDKNCIKLIIDVIFCIYILIFSIFKSYLCKWIGSGFIFSY